MFFLIKEYLFQDLNFKRRKKRLRDCSKFFYGNEKYNNKIYSRIFILKGKCLNGKRRNLNFQFFEFLILIE